MEDYSEPGRFSQEVYIFILIFVKPPVFDISEQFISV